MPVIGIGTFCSMPSEVAWFTSLSISASAKLVDASPREIAGSIFSVVWLHPRPVLSVPVIAASDSPAFRPIATTSSVPSLQAAFMALLTIFMAWPSPTRVPQR